MNEGLQTNQLATCDLFPVAMMSFTPATLLMKPLLNICRSAPTLFKTNRFCSLLSEKENKKLKIEQSYT